MPKAARYKPSSVIYFSGDASDRIFILKSGKILLKTIDIETGEEIRELVSTGEFFGVKSALGKFPRDETVTVLQEAEVLVMSVPEFEQLVSSNPRVITKMLKVFSNQLRRIHSKVQNLMTKGQEMEPEAGLFSVGEYYYNSRQYRQAASAYSRYLIYYPDGRYAASATAKLSESEQAQGGGGGGGASREPFPSSVGGPGAPRPASPAGSGDGAKEYYAAVSLMSQGQYAQALETFKKLAAETGQEHAAKAEFDWGRCLVALQKFEEAIRHFTQLIQKYPRHPDLKEALFHIGQAYEGKGDGAHAKNFYDKVISLAGEDEPVSVKARKALRSLEVAG